MSLKSNNNVILASLSSLHSPFSNSTPSLISPALPKGGWIPLGSAPLRGRGARVTKRELSEKRRVPSFLSDSRGGQERRKLSDYERAYLAGFFDGDGSIITQIVKDNTRKFKFQIRISIVFYQKSTHHWFILWLKELFAPHGHIVKRKSGMSEFVIVAIGPVESVLNDIYPYLKLKKPLCKFVLNIIKEIKNVQTEADFLKVCEMVDETAKYTYSKTRKINHQTVKQYLNNLPVETSKRVPVPERRNSDLEIVAKTLPE